VSPRRKDISFHIYCRDGGVAQAVNHLPSKCEVLSSNPRVAKQKHDIGPLSFPRNLITHVLGYENATVLVLKDPPCGTLDIVPSI
jgi:hypothetical protein